MTYHTQLPDRGVIAITGDDCVSFLQGIVSNDVEKISRECAGYGAFLTPQGKYLHDFFMLRVGETILVDTERSRIADFIKRLSLYKLRADVQIEDVSDQYIVAAIFGDDALAKVGLDAVAGTVMQLPVGAIYVDPRLAEAGLRIAAPHEADILSLLDSMPVEQSKYDEHRINLGLPDGSRDLVPEKSVLLENGFDELNGVDWNKGCYMGQEVTARTKHRGLVKKRLMPVTIDGEAPEPGTTIMAGEREAGEMHSSSGAQGLAMIKLDYLDGDVALQAGRATVTPRKTSWATY
jgi:folate-binding protein YgfZ